MHNDTKMIHFIRIYRVYVKIGLINNFLNLQIMIYVYNHTHLHMLSDMIPLIVFLIDIYTTKCWKLSQNSTACTNHIVFNCLQYISTFWAIPGRLSFQLDLIYHFVLQYFLYFTNGEETEVNAVYFCWNKNCM